MKRKALMFATAAMLSSAMATMPVVAQEAKSRADWIGKGQLYIGVNYQPVDRSPEEVKLDVALMKKAGLQVVRIGDLSWDDFEPRNGEFSFERFDSVMDQMQAAGIKVILEVPGSIAPLWLHHQYPGVTLTAENGTPIFPNRRYMLNISDPDYRRLLYRFTDIYLKRYASRPGVIAIGYNNEMGNGNHSYSEADRQRFITWLKAKYQTLPALNKAWASQRWSRAISDWDEIRMPGTGSPVERSLDLRRFWSNEAITLLIAIDDIRKKYAPKTPAMSNLWPGGKLGFDWARSYRKYATHASSGYYSTDPLGGTYGTLSGRGGMEAPFWYNEFQAGREGYYGDKGRSPMLANLALLNGVQGILAWTWNSHLGGEEQILFGLLDHDNTPSWKVDEWSKLAAEFKAMQKLGFPREVKPQIAIGNSWESSIAASRVTDYYKTPYGEQKQSAFVPLYKDNIDVAVLDITYSDISKYKLLVLPGEYLMDKASTDAVRKYVADGGTVVMTAFSDKANETAQWYNTPLPGNLTDVFGIKTHEFSTNPEPLTGTINGASFNTTIHTYEVLEPSTAKVLSRFTNVEGSPPAITVNSYGKGKAIYVATISQQAVFQPLYRNYLYQELGLKRGLATPDGVYARVVDGRTLYVNTNRRPVEVTIEGQKKGILTGKTWTGKLQLAANGYDLLE